MKALLIKLLFNKAQRNQIIKALHQYRVHLYQVNREVQPNDFHEINSLIQYFKKL